MYFSKNIKHLRVLKGLTTRQLGDEIDVSQGTISRWETATAEPGSEMIQRVATFFGLPVEYFIREDLASKWTTWREVDKWKEREIKARAVAESNMKDTALAPIRSKVLTDHYIRTVAKLKGVPEQEVQDEIEALFEQEVRQVQESVRGTTYGSKLNP